MDVTHEPEVWRPIPGYEGSYEVSDRGRVRSLDRLVPSKGGYPRIARGRVLKPGHLRRQGHQYVNLGKGNSRYVHQLVAAVFIGPCPPGLEVCHNNGKPTDNRVENLRYDTHLANIQDMFKHGTHPHAKKTACKWGHEYSALNTSYRVRPNGRTNRVCLACKRKQYRDARRAA